MGYLILIGFVLALAALLMGLVFAFKRLSRLHFALLVTLLVGVPCGALKLYERRFMLEAVPDALNVNWISYHEEESWGFGPGGNEAGIRTYPLSDEVADVIDARGMEFFVDLPPNENQAGRGWRGVYSDWHATPIKPSQRWEPEKNTGRFDIYSYVCAYGFCIDIEPDVVEDVTAIVNAPGSYYAYGRIGLIVVSPKEKLVVYLYNG